VEAATLAAAEEAVEAAETVQDVAEVGSQTSLRSVLRETTSRFVFVRAPR
jgi:hypothetical protein